MKVKEFFGKLRVFGLGYERDERGLELQLVIKVFSKRVLINVTFTNEGNLE